MVPFELSCVSIITNKSFINRFGGQTILRIKRSVYTDWHASNFIIWLIHTAIQYSRNSSTVIRRACMVMNPLAEELIILVGIYE